MMNYKYEVKTHLDGEEIIFRTNNPNHAIRECFDACEESLHVSIMDGLTGEMLAILNTPEVDDYVTDEMALMMLGWLCETEWGRDDAEESELKAYEMYSYDIPDSVRESCDRPIPQPAQTDDPIISLLSELFGVSTDAIITMPH